MEKDKNRKKKSNDEALETRKSSQGSGGNFSESQKVEASRVKAPNRGGEKGAPNLGTDRVVGST